MGLNSATRRALVTTATALAATVMFAAPAYAHARLVKAVAAADGTATAPFSSVTLSFNEPVRQQSTSVVVTGADGASYSDGAARVVDSDVIQAVRQVPAGPVHVTWKSVSADGDPIQGGFGFTVAPSAVPTTAPPTTAPPTTVPPTATQNAAAPPTKDAADEQATNWLPWTVAAVVVVLLAVGGVYARRRRRHEP